MRVRRKKESKVPIREPIYCKNHPESLLGYLVIELLPGTSEVRERSLNNSAKYLAKKSFWCGTCLISDGKMRRENLRQS